MSDSQIQADLIKDPPFIPKGCLAIIAPAAVTTLGATWLGGAVLKRFLTR